MNVQSNTSRHPSRFRLSLAMAILAALFSTEGFTAWVPVVWPGNEAPRFGDPLAACKYSYNDIYGFSQTLIGVSTNQNAAGVVNRVSCYFPWIGGSRLHGIATLECPAGSRPAPWAPGGCAPQTQSDPGEPSCAAKVGNPINLVSGNKYERVTDFSTPGPNRLALVRIYNGQWNSTSRIGAGWRTNFDRTFSRDGTNWIRMTLGDGREAVFKPLTSGGADWSPAYVNSAGTAVVAGRSDQSWALRQDPSGWTFTDTDGTVETYDLDRRLVSIAYVGGYAQTLTYDGVGNNVAVTDSYGRQISFGYTSLGIMTSATTPDGQRYSYHYIDRSAQVSGSAPSTDVVSPGVVLGSVTLPALGPLPSDQITYHYEDPANLTALTGITEPDGVRYATWAYDAMGYAVSSEHADGRDRVEIAYDLSGNTRTVTGVLGRRTTYVLGAGQGALQRIEQIQGQADSTCAATTRQMNYDSNGYLNQLIDAEGHLATITNDSKGRPLTRVEGQGTEQARTIKHRVECWLPVARADRRARPPYEFHVRPERKPAVQGHLGYR